MKTAGVAIAPWVETMAGKGLSFYKVVEGKRYYYDVATQDYKLIPGAEYFIILSDLKEKTIWKNVACNLVDIGDGVAGFSWNTKMNSIGGEVLEGLNKSNVVVGLLELMLLIGLLPKLWRLCAGDLLLDFGEKEVLMFAKVR